MLSRVCRRAAGVSPLYKSSLEVTQFGVVEVRHLLLLAQVVRGRLLVGTQRLADSFAGKGGGNLMRPV